MLPGGALSAERRARPREPEPREPDPRDAAPRTLRATQTPPAAGLQGLALLDSFVLTAQALDRHCSRSGPRFLSLRPGLARFS